MTRQERRKRRRQRRRRMQAALLASLLFALVLIVTLRIRETAPEPVAERTSALAAERQALTYIAPARPEAAEETPEELTVEPEPENRYAELHFSDEDVYILACLPCGNELHRLFLRSKDFTEIVIADNHIDALVIRRGRKIDRIL